MSIAKNLKFLTLGTAALIVSGAVFAAGETPSASMSPAAQADWDNAHRDVASFNTGAAKDRSANQLLAKSGAVSGKAPAAKSQVPAQDTRPDHSATN
jgi:hypothetical protein